MPAQDFTVFCKHLQLGPTVLSEVLLSFYFAARSRLRSRTFFFFSVKHKMLKLEMESNVESLHADKETERKMSAGCDLK